MEVSTVDKPQVPLSSAAAADDDPTGVRALLSALPEPGPMPEHLIQRIHLSLAAEQAQRAAAFPSDSVSPLLTHRRWRPGRPLLAMAGAAAGVVLVAAVGTTIFAVNQPAATSSNAVLGVTSGPQADTREAAPSATGKSADDKAAAGSAAAPPVIQIRTSETRYTAVGFVTQARILRDTPLPESKPQDAKRAGSVPAEPDLGLTGCLSAIGAARAQVVRADAAFYEGQPALIIVASTNGIPMAYVVGRQCSKADAGVLRPATALP